jgi:hypothetical protein
MANLPSCCKAFLRLLSIQPDRAGKAQPGKAQPKNRTSNSQNLQSGGNVMRKYMIEREIAKVGSLSREQLQAASAKSNEVLHQLGPEIQWLESFVTADKTFCVYLAKDEAIIRRHAELSGFPANRITEIGGKIDPSTAGPQ